MTQRLQLDALKKDRSCMERALAEVGAVRKGTAYCCPFHEDSNASAGIHQSDDGTWLYTCRAASCGWNNGKGSGDALAVLAHGGKNFKAAVEFLDGNSTPSTPVKAAPKRSIGSQYNERFAQECSVRLISDETALLELWRTRAVDRENAGLFGVGITEDGTWWTFTIRDVAGKFIAIKGHRRSGNGKKGIWLTQGVKSTHLYPIVLKHDGPVWLCPGEFKALAVISAGRNAIGITSGEDVALPLELADLLRGRIVAVAPDADRGGETWLTKRVRPFCKEHGIDLSVVDLGLDKEAGLKDIGDFIRREAVEDARERESIAATLDDKFKLSSDPWHKYSIGAILNSRQTWEKVEHIPTGFRDIQSAVGGLRTRAVHIFSGRSGRAKTQTVIAMATNAAILGYPVGIFSLELDTDEVGRLIAAQQSQVSRTRLDEGRLHSDEIDRFRDRFGALETLPITIMDADKWGAGLDRDTLADIVADGVRALGWRMIILDYFNLLAAIECDRSDYQADLLNSAALKRIARQNRVAFNVVAALRKPPPTRKGASTIPTLDEVAGAGRIVYDAVSVWYTDAKQYNGEPPSGIVELYPLKTRFSRAAHIGTPIVLDWAQDTGSITDGAFPK